MLQGDLPMKGVRVIDLTHVLAGPFATMLMGDLGAEILKIEKPGRGDTTRGTPPYFGDVSHYFIAVNRNKRSVGIDIKTPEGRDLLLGLARKADVIVNNFRPGVLDRLGLGYDILSEANPRLINCSVSGFGNSGPLTDKPAFDMIIQSMSGFMSLTGEPDRDPVRCGVSIGDLVSGLYAVIAVATALFDRERTGRGQNIDISMLDSLVSLLTYYVTLHQATGKTPERTGTMHASMVPGGTFPTADGHITLAAFNQRFWRALCEAIEEPELAEHPRFASPRLRYHNSDELIAHLRATLGQKTTEEWARRFDRHDVPYGPVLTIPQLLEHPQIQARTSIFPLSLPDLGSVHVSGQPIRFAGTETGAYRNPPDLGADTRDVLINLLNIDEDRYQQLESSNIVGTGGQGADA